jgi:hypothetical protein
MWTYTHSCTHTGTHTPLLIIVKYIVNSDHWLVVTLQSALMNEPLHSLSSGCRVPAREAISQIWNTTCTYSQQSPPNHWWMCVWRTEFSHTQATDWALLKNRHTHDCDWQLLNSRDNEAPFKQYRAARIQTVLSTASFGSVVCEVEHFPY